MGCERHGGQWPAVSATLSFVSALEIPPPAAPDVCGGFLAFRQVFSSLLDRPAAGALLSWPWQVPPAFRVWELEEGPLTKRISAFKGLAECRPGGWGAWKIRRGGGRAQCGRKGDLETGADVSLGWEKLSWAWRAGKCPSTWPACRLCGWKHALVEKAWLMIQLA